MKKFLLTITLLLAAFAAPAQPWPFNPKDAAVVSAPEDLMAHCSTFAFDGKGNVYFAYYKDSEQPIEHAANLSTFPVLAKADIKTMTVQFRKDVIRSGQTIGDFTHGPRAPYDPNVLVLGKTLMVYFNGCVGTEVTFCARPYDMATDSFQDRIIVCKLNYVTQSGERKCVDLNAKNTFALFDDMGIESQYYNDLCISARFIRHKGAWYGALGNAFTKCSKPIIVKTVDGVNFDVVHVCEEFQWGACEVSLEFSHGSCYVAMRTSGCPKDERGTWIARYSKDWNCLVQPVRLGKCQSKTALVDYKGKIYAFYNDWPNLDTEWGNVMRSRLRVAQIERNCGIVKSWDVTNDVGIHYPYVNENKGKLYLSFTEDRKKIDVHQCRSNISFIQVKF